MFKSVAVVLTLVPWLVRCDLTIGAVKCGQKTCKQYEYCSSFDRTCASCLEICSSSSHNYDETLCVKDCQEYLHDQRYVIKNGSGSGNENITDTVQQLSKIVTVTLTLVCLMLLVLASVLGFQLYRWKIKKNITMALIKQKIFGRKSSDEVTPTKTQSQSSDNKKADLRLEMPSTVTGSDHSPVTVTTSISRRPAEDSTLDYAYDNPTMHANSR